MDSKNVIVNDTISKIITVVDSTQLEQISNALVMVLSNYEVQQRTTEVATVDDTAIKLLKRFIVAKELSGRTKNTLKRYYETISPMLLTLNKPISEVDSFDIQNYLISYKNRTDKPCSNATLDGMRRCFSSFFTWLCSNEYITKNPMNSVPCIKSEKKIKQAYADTDIEKIKRDCQCVRDRALVEFLYSTGCRVSEVVSLNQTDVNFVTKTVLVKGKGNKQRIVYLSDVALLYLTEYLNSRTDTNPSLFTSRKAPHDRLKKGAIERVVHNLGYQNGIHAYPHKYRRTLATNLLDRGADIADISKLLGHTDINTTMIYYAQSQEHIQQTFNRLI